ncbi:MAG: Gfo/Idh/MocA family oxidoreductase [Chloroflexota bacterium]
MPALRWGLIGASDVAATRMIPAMRRLGHQVSAVGDPTPDWAAAYAAKNEIPASGSVEELVARDDVDAVYISTKNEFHRDHAIPPRGPASTSCARSRSRSRSTTGRRCWRRPRRRASSWARTTTSPAATRTARSASWSRPAPSGGCSRSASSTRSRPPRLQGWRLASKAGGGVALDVTCHDAAVINPLVGELPSDLVALSTKQGSWEAAAEDALMSTMRYANGVLVQTHDAFTVAYAPTGMHVIGEDGAILATNVMTQEPIGTVVLRDAQGEREIDIPNRRDLYDINVSGFAAAVSGEADRPVVTGLEGLQAAQVALAVRQAADTGERVVL